MNVVGSAVLFLVKAAIAVLYCERLFGRRRKLAVTVAAFAAGYALLFGISLLGLPILDVAAFFAVNGALLYIPLGCGIKTAALHAALLSAAMAGSELLVLLTVRLFGGDFATSSATSGTGSLLYLLLSFVAVRFFASRSGARDESRMPALFLGLSAVSILVSFTMLYLGSHAEPGGTTEAMVVRNIFVLLAINLLFLLLSNYMRKLNAERTPAQQEAVDNGYEALREQYDSQRRLVHDIKNHLYAIEGLAVEGNATEVVSYISGLEGGLTPMSPVRLSSDPVLNTILVRFREDCRRKGVAFTYDLREGGAAFMDAPEVTTLYGNLLSNAIEAAAGSEEKTVELSIVHNIAQDVLIVSVNNSCDSAPLLDSSGRMLSRKRDGRTQGVGLRSIERVVEKYRGVETLYYDAEHRRFHHIIQFPVTR